MASSTITKNLRDGAIQIWDGATPTPNKITLSLLEGNLTFSETTNTINVLDRGSISSPAHQRTGDDAPVTGSFTAKFCEFISSGAEGPTLYEALTKTGTASGWTSASGATTDVWSLVMKFYILDPDSGDTEPYEVLTFATLSPTSIEFSEGDEFDTMAVSFQSFEVRPAIAKSASAPA